MREGRMLTEDPEGYIASSFLATLAAKGAEV